MPKAGPLVRVVIVNYNGGDCLPRCLAALAAQTFTDFEVVVADNASTDGSAGLDLPDGRFRWLHLERNLGFAAGNNRAADGFEGEWLVTLNPDAFAEPTWLERLLDAGGRHPGAVMLGSTQLDANDPRRLDGAGDCYFVGGIMWRGGFGRPVSDLPAHSEAEAFGPCAAAAAYRYSAFRAVGGFDESFFCYCEDVDLAFRLRLAGGYCVQVGTAVVAHVGSAISGRASDFTAYHGSRNRFWVFVKDMPAVAFWPLLPVHLALNLALIVRAAVTGCGGATLRGLLDGVRGLPSVWAQRRRIQAGRRASVRAVLGAMDWLPFAFLARKPSVRPLAGGKLPRS